MGTDQRQVLTINAGSSSVKLALFGFDTLEPSLEAAVANLGQAHTKLIVTPAHGAPTTHHIKAAHHREALSLILERLHQHTDLSRVVAIGHRIVHGGPSFTRSVMIYDDVIQALKSLREFDPLHMPASIELIHFFGAVFAHVPQVACFDTEFYKDMPRVAQMLPLPRKLQTIGLRRYGFHGLSYEYVLEAFAEKAGKKAAHGKLIIAHLGSGASITALKDAHAMDTTMSFTPASGIPMSTRSGNLDPGIVDYLHRKLGMTPTQFNHMVNFESGLKGISERTPDMEVLIQKYYEDERAADAVNLFCYEVRKTIGSFMAVLGGMDSLIFTGGMGQVASFIRAKICEDLDFAGVELDAHKNQQHAFLISKESSKVGVHVIPTNEAAIVARKTKQVIKQESGSHL